MTKKLPSLNVLKVFDTAARQGSFKLAAQELCLSPSAVSHQIRVLEEQLGVMLFERLNRSIKLTIEGEQYHKDIQTAMSLIERATDRLVGANQKKSITISCIPFVTNHFLIPHLPTFKQAHSDYSIKLLSQIKLMELKHGQVDLAVRYQKQDRNDLEYVPLTNVSLTPVCNPEYWLKFEQTGQGFDDHKFISLSVDTKTWTTWLSQFRPTNTLPDFEIELDNYQAVKQAAVQGLGLAMGYWPAVQDEVSKGNLIAPYGEQVSEFGAMYLVYPKVDQDRDSVRIIRDWMVSIFQQFTVS